MDTFKYRVSDGKGGTASAEVTINVVSEPSAEITIAVTATSTPGGDAVADDSKTFDEKLYLTFTTSVPTENFTKDDITINNAVIDDFKKVSSKIYTGILKPIDGEEAVSVDVAAGVFTDENGFENVESSTFDWEKDSIEITIESFDVADSLEVGDSVGTVSVNKSSSAIVFSILSGDTDKFEIVSDTGEITLKSTLDYKSNTEHSVEVQATIGTVSTQRNIMFFVERGAAGQLTGNETYGRVAGFSKVVDGSNVARVDGHFEIFDEFDNWIDLWAVSYTHLRAHET